MTLNPEQIEIRKTGITASEIAGICGMNSYDPPGKIWAAKLGMIEPFAGNEHTERGNELEEALVKWTGRRLGLGTYWNGGDNATTYRSKKEPLALATPDGFLLDGALKSDPVATIEVKAPSWTTANEWKDPAEYPDGCPRRYLIQSVWQAGVLDLPESVVSGLVDGRLWTYRIPFSQKLFDALLERALAFWKYVEKREPPQVEPGQSSAWVSEAYREQLDRDIVDVPREKMEDVVNAAQTYALARDAARRAKLDMESSKGYLCSLIEEHEGLRIPGWHCAWKQQGVKKELDWEQVAKRAIDALAGRISLDEIDKWYKEATKTKPGIRMFNLKQET